MSAKENRIKTGDRILVTDTGQTGYAKEMTSHGSWVVHLSDDPEYIDRTFFLWDLENITPHVPGEDIELDRRLEKCLKEIVDPMIEERP